MFRSYCSLLFKFWTLRIFEPPFGDLRTMYDVHLGLIGKRVVDFLLVLIELFSLGVTAEDLRAKRDRKSAPSLQSVWSKISGTRGRSPPIIFARIVRPMNALQLCRWQFSQKNYRNSIAHFLQAKCDFRPKSAVLRFWAPLGGLGATYDDHIMLIGKRVVDFLLVLIELFFARCYGWGSTREYRFKIGDFAPKGSSWPKVSNKSDRPPRNILLLRKLAKWFLYGIKNLDRSFFRFVTIHAFDGQLSHRYTASAFHAVRTRVRLEYIVTE